MQTETLGYFPKGVWGECIFPHLGVRDLQAMACTSKKLNSVAQDRIKMALQKDFPHIEKIKDQYFADITWMKLAGLLQREGAIGVEVGSEVAQYQRCKQSWQPLGDAGAITALLSIVPLVFFVTFGAMATIHQYWDKRLLQVVEGAFAVTGTVMLGCGIAGLVEGERRQVYSAGPASYADQPIWSIWHHDLAKRGRQGRLGGQRQVNFALLARVVYLNRVVPSHAPLQQLYQDCK